jgi:hypothetical protein
VAGAGVAGTGVGQSLGPTLNTHFGHLTISITPVKKGEAVVILQFYKLLLVWDVVPHVQVLLYLQWRNCSNVLVLKMHVISETDVFKLPVITLNFTFILGNWKTSSKMKLARFRKPKATCFLLCVENRPNTNTSNIIKTGHAKETGRVTEGS